MFNEAGQLITQYKLSDNPTSTLNMDVSLLVTGINSVRGIEEGEAVGGAALRGIESGCVG